MPSPVPSSATSELVLVKTLLAQGDVTQAEKDIEALITREPENAAAWHLKGLIKVKTGDGTQAVTCFNTALQFDPGFKDACADLGRLLEAAGHFELAVKTFEHLLRIEQTPAPAAKKPVTVNEAGAKTAKKAFADGRVLQEKGDSLGAVAAFRKVLKFYPMMPEALTNLGIALSSLRQYDEAIEVLLACLRVKPGYAPAILTLGTCYKDTNQRAMAIAAYRQVLMVEPKHVPAAVNIGKTYFEKDFEQAIKAYEHALTIDPGCVEAICDITYLAYRLCKWDKAKTYRQHMEMNIAAQTRPMGPFVVATMVPSASLQLINARRYSAGAYAAGKPFDPAFALPSALRGDGKLRIGYLSADFQDHATARLISELFEQHDRSQFEIFAYSHGFEDSRKEARARIRAAVDRFHDLYTANDQEVVSLIKKEGIDILVDLKGYTLDHRLSVMAQRPAPIQMHYLGFPGTIGACFIDYFISDKVASPPGADALFTERLIRLPHSYQINDRKRALPTGALPRSAYGLPESAFVFGDFNNAYKITPDVFEVWMRLLLAVEGSVLWLSEADASATANLRMEAQKHGVDPLRLIPAKSMPQAEHLQRYRHIDLFLDTSPVCGHTTTSDALWCGVPVVTMAKESFISRVAASLLSAVGLPELATTNLADYEALALSLARDKDKLQAVRRHLEEGRMHLPLFDATATTRALEAAYLHAANIHRQGLAPQAFALSPDLQIS